MRGRIGISHLTPTQGVDANKAGLGSRGARWERVARPGSSDTRLADATRPAHNSAMPAIVTRPIDPTSEAAVGLIAVLDTYLSTLYPAASTHPLPLTSFLEPGGVFLGAFDGDRLVGCCGYVLRPGYAELKRLYVRAEVRGGGIAYRLLADLEELARAAGVRALRLETGVSQADAIRVCERAGFVECGAFGDYRPDPLSVFMEKRLDEVG